MKGGTAFAAASMLSGPALLEWAKAWAQAAPWKPEKGAKINLMRWRRFVQAEDEAFVKMINAFKQATGVDVVVTNESFEDIQPKASVAANTGSGPRHGVGPLFAAAPVPAEVHGPDRRRQLSRQEVRRLGAGGRDCTASPAASGSAFRSPPPAA